MTNVCRESILRERLEMAQHNLLCYSKTYLCNAPMEGKENEFKKSLAEIEILKAWLKEFHSARGAGES